MEIRDYGTSVSYCVNCYVIAELQFTPDFGRVLLVNPRCLTGRQWAGIEKVRPEYQRHFDAIAKRWQIDRIRVRR